MATTLTFVKDNDGYSANFTSKGSCVIQIERDKPSLIAVQANLEGMNPVPVTNFQNGYTPNAIFEIDVPAGVDVTIKSSTEVTNAKML